MRPGLRSETFQSLDGRAKQDTVTHGSLFAGVEGFGLGFQQAGYETIWQVEREPYCIAVYAVAATLNSGGNSGGFKGWTIPDSAYYQKGSTRRGTGH